MPTRAQIIDRYFANNYTHYSTPYRPIGEIMIEEVRRQGEDGLYLSTAAALIEQESAGRNQFGCDWGPKWTDTPPYCQVAVTRARVQALIKNFEAGGGQNGIGLTQLTSREYVYAAERMGGAHLPRYQMRVGFRLLLQHIRNLGWPAGAAAYNAGAGNWRSVIDTYGASMARLERRWQNRLSRAGQEGGIDLSKYRPRTRYGLSAHTDKVLQHLEEKFGPYLHIEGYRAAVDGTEHNTRRSFDLWWRGGANHDGRQAAAVANYVVKNRVALRCEGITQANSQIGWERGYSDWSGWLRQWFQPTGWSQAEIDRRDAYHWRHGHYQFWN